MLVYQRVTILSCFHMCFFLQEAVMSYLRQADWDGEEMWEATEIT